MENGGDGRLRQLGLKAVVLVDDTFEDFEVLYPFYRFQEEGVDVQIVGHEPWKYRSGYGYNLETKVAPDQVDVDALHVLVVPGGWSKEFITRSKPQLDLIRVCHERSILIAAICVGKRVVQAAGITEGRKLVPNDQPVLRDGNLITSRRPSDVPYFCRAIFQALEEKYAKPVG